MPIQNKHRPATHSRRRPDQRQRACGPMCAMTGPPEIPAASDVVRLDLDRGREHGYC